MYFGTRNTSVSMYIPDRTGLMPVVFGVFIMNDDEYVSEKLVGLFESFKEAEEVARSLIQMEQKPQENTYQYRWELIRPYIGKSHRSQFYDEKTASLFKYWYVDGKKYYQLVLVEQIEVQSIAKNKSTDT